MRTTLYRVFAIASTVASLGACADHAYDPKTPPNDTTAPVLAITTPSRGQLLGDVTTVAVTGTATDDQAVAGVTVNGVNAVVKTDGTWSATVPVTPGTTLIHAVATDSTGNTAKASRSVVAGKMTPINTVVTDSITAAMSPQTIQAIGDAAAGFISTADLTTLISAYNPVIEDGTDNGQLDCLAAIGTVTKMTVGGAKISLAPMDGGMNFDAELQNVFIAVHLDYAFSCIDGSKDITVSATNVSIKGPLTVAAAQGQFDIALASPDVTFTGFDLELGGLTGDIADALDLNTAISGLVADAVEDFVTPVLNNSFAGLANSAKTVDVMGTAVAVNVTPDTVVFETTGATIKLDTSLRAAGDGISPGYIDVPVTPPTMSTASGFELAIAQGAANQLLSSLWSVGALNQTIDLTTGSYGAIGTLYDAVQIQALGLPYVDATGTGLKLTLGDLMVSFKNGTAVTTEIAVNAEVDITVAADPVTGALSLGVGTPTTYVDILSDNVTGANQLSNQTFDAITSFALSRIVAYGSSALGAVPLPSLGGVSVQNVSVAAQTGYLVVNGSAQ